MAAAKMRTSPYVQPSARLADVALDAPQPETSELVYPSGRVALPAKARRRPLLLVLGAASIILLASAGAYRHPPAVETFRTNVVELRAKVGKWLPKLSKAIVIDDDVHFEADVMQPADADDGEDETAPALPADDQRLGTTASSEPSGDVLLDNNGTGTAIFRLQSAPSHFPAYMSDSAFLDTRPRSRPPIAWDAGERYLSYNPHSGFHNQRIEFENALVLAQMLNRTLLMPLVRLGVPQGWAAHHGLQRSLERDQKHEKSQCIQQLEQLERSKVPGPCENYTAYTLVSWDTLIDMGPVEDSVRLVERNDISRAWFTSPDGLGLSDDDIESFEDPDRYSVRFYDSRKDSEKPGRYTTRINVQDLVTGPMAQKRLLEFGSFFGSGRVKATKHSHRLLGARAQRQMVFRNPLLTRISDELVGRLGGRDSYVGLHLRVGDGAFKRQAHKNMIRVFRQLCADVFRLDRRTIDKLIQQSKEAHAQTRNHVRRGELPRRYSLLDDFDPRAFSEAPVSQVQHEKLAVLNRPVYIATDARNPRSHADLALFFDTFPCAFVLDDFSDVPDLQELERVRSLQEGVKMASFLFPFLEAIMAARSLIATLGTPGSTFSGFAASTLHRIYSQELDLHSSRH